MSGSMTVMQYASKLAELSRFVQEFVSFERLRLRRFEEGLTFYIRNQLVGQTILTYQELYEQAAEVERVKAELRALNLINRKWKLAEQEALSDSVNQKKSTLALPNSHPAGSTEPCGKCEGLKHTTPQCQV